MQINTSETTAEICFSQMNTKVYHLLGFDNEKAQGYASVSQKASKNDLILPQVSFMLYICHIFIGNSILSFSFTQILHVFWRVFF